MTSVILSNRVNEKNIVGMDDSIYKAWSFKNNLSSNVVIPANSQVALQSCKVNVDGTYSLNLNGEVFYQYYGQQLSSTLTQYQSTSATIQAGLLAVVNGITAQANTTELATLIQNALNLSSHHPNNMGRWSVERKLDSSTGEFKGFIYKLVDQYVDSTLATANKISTTAISNYTPNQLNNNFPVKNWIYGIVSGKGEFETTSDKPYPAVALLPELPISLNRGEFIVDFSDANSHNVDWVVGLSRSNSITLAGAGGFSPVNPNRILSPRYFSLQRGGEWNFDFFCDYAVYRYGDTLYLAHNIINPSETGGYSGQHPYCSFMKDLAYTDGQGQLGSLYDLSTNSNGFAKVKFVIINEQVNVYLLQADNTSTTLYEYAAVSNKRTKHQNLKPVSQACKCLHPVLYSDSTTAQPNNKLIVERFYGAPIGSNSAISGNPLLNVYEAGLGDGLFGGWYEYLHKSGMDSNVQALETRDWNNYDPANTNTHVYLGSQNSNKNLEGEPIIITKPSELYFNSGNANTSELLGFKNDAIIDTFELGTGGDSETFIQESISIPQTLNPRAIFVRLDNIPTSNINAFKGNKSTIISMLPRVNNATETGRIGYEPNTLMYVDLQNSQEIRLNNFDISFCYVDETFATNLSGQSVVVLHFKVKGE